MFVQPQMQRLGSRRLLIHDCLEGDHETSTSSMDSAFTEMNDFDTNCSHETLCH